MNSPESSRTTSDTVEVKVAIVSVLREVSRRQYTANKQWASAHKVFYGALREQESIAFRYPTWMPSGGLQELYRVAENALEILYFDRETLQAAVVHFCDAFIVGVVSPNRIEPSDEPRRMPEGWEKDDAKRELMAAARAVEWAGDAAVAKAAAYHAAVGRAAADAERELAEAKAREAEREVERARHGSYPTGWARLGVLLEASESDTEPPLVDRVVEPTHGHEQPLQTGPTAT